MTVGRTVAGRYRLTAQLGEGGMGSVWRAHDYTLNAEVAIKLIDPQLASSTEALARFKREAQSAAAIRSTYVVQIFDYGVDEDGTPYIVMEMLRGENLAERLDRVGALNPVDTARLLAQVARALSTAHEAGIVHRDLKPDNIFLVNEGDEYIAKVLDFGIARRMGGMGETGKLRTKTGAVLGTPYYMSPEQSIGQPVNHLTDVWSFGVIAYECLTGARAFDSESLGGLFHAICMAPMPVPSAICSVPEGFDDWFTQATAREQTHRFQSVRAASDALKAICKVEGAVSTGAAIEQCVPTIPLPRKVEQTAKVIVRDEGAISGLKHTAPPAAHTVPGLPRRSSRFVATATLFGGALILAGGGYAIWYGLFAEDAPPPVPAAMSAAASATLPTARASSSGVFLATPPPAPPTAAPQKVATTEPRKSTPVVAESRKPTPPVAATPKPASTPPAAQRAPSQPSLPNLANYPVIPTFQLPTIPTINNPAPTQTKKRDRNPAGI